MRIMLDPGHAGSYYNASPVVPGYYESNMTWALSLKLKAALEVRGFEVGLTRYDKNEDPELTERGRRARGYDLFISLHSNAAGSSVPDAPWIIHFADDAATSVDEKSRAAAEVLGPVVSEVMGVSAPYYYTKKTDFDRDGNGKLDDEYYGVLFGAKSVGVPGIIIEHSFHTNERAARWLSSEENLDKLAEAEADALAKYYCMKEIPMTTAERKEFDALKASLERLESENGELKHRLDRYDDMGVYDNAAVKWAYIDGNLPEWAAPTVKKLASKGHLKGNGANSLELSYLMLRLLVILDRAGVFE